MYPQIAGFTCPETQEQRRAGMAAFRAKLVATHRNMLAGGDPNTRRKGAVGDAARKYHATSIATLEAAQRKFGEVA